MTLSRIAIASLLSALLAACNASTTPAPAPAKLSATPETPSLDDACATRLHEIEELLMIYAASTRDHQLPPTLEALAPFADKKLDLTCPVSGKPYIYKPAGLVTSGDPRMLILYDATPAHDGKRQAILLTPPKSGRAPVLDVILITDEILKAFHAPPAPAPAP